jgi:hypothetical protein
MMESLNIVSFPSRFKAFLGRTPDAFGLQMSRSKTQASLGSQEQRADD